jgi:hypothetical protein
MRLVTPAGYAAGSAGGCRRAGAELVGRPDGRVVSDGLRSVALSSEDRGVMTADLSCSG